MIDIMPTPATHLASAQVMLDSGDLSVSARRLFSRQLGAFMLGHTAPDVKTITGQRREMSHFYTIPRTSKRPACQVLLDSHPALRDAELLSMPQAAFVAGYQAHLLMDELWLVDIFQPFFLQDWGVPAERMFLHNVLRTWVDQCDQMKLNGVVSQVLRTAEPDGWLPFVEDHHLRLWRDWLAEQLAPGRTMETAEVLAPRVGATAEEMNAVAQSPEQMESRVFSHFPRSALEAFQLKSQIATTRHVNRYIGKVGSGPSPRSALSSLDDWCADLRATEEVPA